jgi:hypothetical protein
MMRYLFCNVVTHLMTPQKVPSAIQRRQLVWMRTALRSLSPRSSRHRCWARLTPVVRMRKRFLATLMRKLRDRTSTALARRSPGA